MGQDLLTKAVETFAVQMAYGIDLVGMVRH